VSLPRAVIGLRYRLRRLLRNGGGDRLWREDRIDALLSNDSEEHPSVLFVRGTTRNQALFYPRFEHIVLLSAPAEVLIERLTTRTTNPYGKDPAELAETLEYLETVEPLLRTAATLEVVTTVPVTRVADIVLEPYSEPSPAKRPVRGLRARVSPP
jgi:hypothetical protein